MQGAIIDATTLLFVAAFGACIGSLINVLAYRIPRGLDFVTPSSRCPDCDTKLTWRENIPILGWLFLRGRCRFCKSRISPEYVIVETFVALLWAFTFAVLYLGSHSELGLRLGTLQPDWGRSGFAATWPLFIVIIVLFSSLVAMTLIDAKTYTIPPLLTNVPTLVAALGHIGFAVYLSLTEGKLPVTEKGWTWSIATPGPHGWKLIGASLGGTVGLIIGNIFLWTGLLRRSFEGYEAWEKQQLEAQNMQAALAADETAAQAAATQPPSADASHKSSGTRDQSVGAETHPELWIQYPHARREVLKEVLFLTPAIALAYLGSKLAAKWAGPLMLSGKTLEWETQNPAPLWLDVTSGVLLGFLIGGGIVWAMRILGTLLFGKEALGLGDVHMMAAVGACLGWIDPVLAFFGAAFLGVGWYVLGKLSKGVASRLMPFGPFLAMGTILIFFCKPLIESLIEQIAGGDRSIHLP